MLVLLCVFCVFKVICSQSYPSSVFVPSNAITTDVSFKCSGSPPIDWQVNGTLYQANIFSHPGVSVVPGSDGSSTLTVPQETVLDYNGSSIRCRTHGDNFSSVPTAFIIVYGPPSEPGGLATSASASDGVLVFSWSPPWAPDGVQLNYTVTVTNTNTSVETVFTTSDTNITHTRDNTTSVNSSSSSQCDQYVWSVTAVNPAGISGPANYTLPVYFPSAPITIQSDVCITNNSKVTLLNFMAQSCTSTENISYTVNVEDICDGSTLNRSYSNGLVQASNPLTVPYTPDCTVINITAKNTIGELSLTVNTSEADECPESQVITTAEATVVTPTITPTPQQSNLNVIIIASAASVGGVLVLGGLVLVLSLVVAMLLIKHKRRKGSTSTKDVKTNNKPLGTLTLPSTLPNNLEMYMDPKDAIKHDVEGHKLEALYADIGPGTTSTIEGSNVMNMPIYSDPWQTQSSTPTCTHPPLLPPPPSQTLPPPPPPPPGQQYASLNRIDNYKISDYQRRDQRRNQTYSSINHPPGIPKKSYSQLQFNRQKSDTTINGLQRLQYSTTVHQKPIFEV